MKAIHAIYENGVFRPLDPVELPEACQVTFEPKVVSDTPTSAGLDELYAILNQRFASGQADVAARHDEHQP